MSKYPMSARKNFYTADKNIYFFFHSSSYLVDVRRKISDGSRKIIKIYDVKNINDARIIRSCLIRYLNSL